MAMASLTGHARSQSEASSFAGFESFEEVRRGFEFGLNRPTFFPPQEARATAWHSGCCASGLACCSARTEVA